MGWQTCTSTSGESRPEIKPKIGVGYFTVLGEDKGSTLDSLELVVVEIYFIIMI